MVTVLFSRAADADRRQKPSVRLDSFRSPLGAHDLILEHQALVAAGAGVAEQIRQWLLSRHEEVFPVCKVDSPLHELCHVDL